MGLFQRRPMLQASASVVTNQIDPIPRLALPWQIEILGTNDMVAEQALITNTIVDACSQCTIRHNGQQVDYNDLIRRAAKSLYLCGEFYLAEIPTTARQDNLPPGAVAQFIPSNDTTLVALNPVEVEGAGGSNIRVWTHYQNWLFCRKDQIKLTRIINPGEYSTGADSWAKASLPILRIMQALAALLVSQATGYSKMIGIPNEIRQTYNMSNELPSKDDTFLHDLRKALTGKKMELDKPTASAPIILEAEAEYLRDVKVFDSFTGFDKQVLPLLEMCIGRLARAQDAPVELLLGNQSGRYGAAEQIRQESTLPKVNKIMPLIIEGLEVYLPGKWEYDPAHVTTNLAHLETILEMVTMGLLKPEIAVEAAGFTKDDMPGGAQ